MQREYWKKQLKDAPYVPHIPMPSDFDRPITDDSLGEEIKVSVPADLVNSLKSLAIACGTTLFVTVLCAWKVAFPTALLSRINYCYLFSSAICTSRCFRLAGVCASLPCVVHHNLP